MCFCAHVKYIIFAFYWITFPKIWLLCLAAQQSSILATCDGFIYQWLPLPLVQMSGRDTMLYRDPWPVTRDPHLSSCRWGAEAVQRGGHLELLHHAAAGGPGRAAAGGARGHLRPGRPQHLQPEGRRKSPPLVLRHAVCEADTLRPSDMLCVKLTLSGRWSNNFIVGTHNECRLAGMVHLVLSGAKVI